MKPTRPHLNQIESLRAIAAFAVAVFHFSAYFYWSDSAVENFKLGAQGVELFYFISGFIITYSLFHSSYSIKDYFKYLGKRFSRLMPPYIVTIILIQIIGILFCTYLWGCDHDINFRQIIINIFFLADAFPNYDWINPIFATLEVEVQFYLLIAIVFPLFKINQWFIVIFGLALIIPGIFFNEFDTVFYNASYFCSGIALFHIYQKISLPASYTLLALSLITIFQFYQWYDLLPVLIGIAFIFIIPSQTKFLSLSGKISYSYYLVHGIAGGWFLFFTKNSDFAISNPWLMILFAMIISWIAAFCLFWIIERPSMKLSRRIKYSK